MSDNKTLLKYFGSTSSDIQVYINILNKIKLVLPKLVLMDSANIIDEYNKSKKNEKTNLSIDTINIIKNYEKRNKSQIKLLCIYQNENIASNKERITSFCDQYGLDHNEILKILKIYLQHHKIVNIVNEWTKKYNNYIPFFENITIDFIYIASYANNALSNIDDQTDIKKAMKDPFSIVMGEKIDGLLKEMKKNIITLKHLISYNELLHVAAIIPALIYPLENNKLLWKDIHFYYKTITPEMIEKYLLPETEKNKADNKRNKLYNTELLSLFRLIREKLKNNIYVNKI